MKTKKFKDFIADSDESSTPDFTAGIKDDATVKVIAPLKYVALLNQTGTDDPIATELQNTLGENITWTRTAQGIYRGVPSGNSFTNNKTTIFLGTQATNLGMNKATIASAALCRISMGDITGTLQDDLLANTPIEITVYP